MVAICIGWITDELQRSSHSLHSLHLKSIQAACGHAGGTFHSPEPYLQIPAGNIDYASPSEVSTIQMKNPTAGSSSSGDSGQVVVISTIPPYVKVSSTEEIVEIYISADRVVYAKRIPTDISYDRAACISVVSDVVELSENPHLNVTVEVLSAMSSQ